MTEKMEAEQEVVEKTLESEMVEIHTSLFYPFYQFLKKLLAFYGSNETVEDMVRQIVYKYVGEQYQGIRDFMSKDSVANGYREKWFEKWNHIAITSYPDEEEEDC